MCLKYCASPEKVAPGHTKCCACHAHHLSKPEDLMLQNAALLRKSAPSPPNISDEMSLVPHPPREASWQMVFKRPAPAIVFELSQNPSILLTFDKVQNSLRVPRKLTFERRGANAACFFTILTSKCASELRLRATTLCTFSASQRPKEARDRPFLALLTWTCASRATACAFPSSQHPKNCSDKEVFSTFWFRNVLRATNPVHFFNN